MRNELVVKKMLGYSGVKGNAAKFIVHEENRQTRKISTLFSGVLIFTI